jgi:hypothetical protein
LTAAVVLSAVALLVLAVVVLCLARALERRGAQLQDARRQLQESGYRNLIGRRVVAQLEGDRSVRGVLKASYLDGHMLAHPEWLASAQPAGMGGELFLPAEKVLLLQVLEPVADEA